MWRILILLCAICISGNAFFTGPRTPPLHHHATIRPSDTHLHTQLSHDEISRYSRHLVLSEVGMPGQKALKEASILVIGAGGLGSPALLYLAAAGVGHLGIVDADTVDSSNLQRQIIHSVQTVGVSKCQSARTSILNINPHVSVRLFEEEFTSQSADRIVSGGFDETHPWTVVIDGSDNFPTKYLINDVCEIRNIPWIYSAILAFEGQLSVFNYRNGPTYRDLLPTPPPPGDVPSCAEGGVLGVLPGTMGCLQATEAIKIVLNKPNICSGRVLVFDALQMKFGESGLQRDPSRSPVKELIDYQGFCSGRSATTIPVPGKANGRTMDEAETSPDDTSLASFHSISPKDCLNKLKRGWSPWILDVRLQTENDIVQLPFTDKVVPHRTVQSSDVPEEGDILVYCKAGVRGKKACRKLIEVGIEQSRLYNLEGGIMRWQRDVDASMPRY